MAQNSGDNNRIIAGLLDGLALTVTGNLLDVLAPTPPPPSDNNQATPAARWRRQRRTSDGTSQDLYNTRNAGVTPVGAAAAGVINIEDTINLETDDEDEGETSSVEDVRRMHEVYFGKFTTRAHRIHLERLLFENLGLEGSPSDITINICNSNPRESYALITLKNRRDVETLLALSPMDFLGGDVTVELSHYASQARQRASLKATLNNQARARPVANRRLSFTELTRPIQTNRTTNGTNPRRQLFGNGMVERVATPPIQVRDRRTARACAATTTVTTVGAAHASLRKQVIEKKGELQRQFRTKFQSLQEEIDTLEGRHRHSEAEKDRLESDLATVKQTLASLASQKETLLQRFCEHSESHDAEMRELERTLTFLPEYQDVQEVPEEEMQTEDSARPAAAAASSEQTPLRSRMTSALECPCCYNDMREEIFQCRLGHLICCNCLRRLRDCPVCRTRYPADPIRALFAEQMAQNLPTTN